MLLEDFLKETWEVLKSQKTHTHTHTHTASEMLCWVEHVQRLLSEGSNLKLLEL